MLRFVCIHVEANAFCCLLQAMQQGFGLGRRICKKHYVICIVCDCCSFCWISSVTCFIFCCFFLVKPFSFIRFSRGRLQADMVLMYPLAELQQQCQRSLCVHPLSEPLLSCKVIIVLILLYGCTIWTLTKHIEKKNATSYIEQILEATLHETIPVRPPTSCLINHSNKTKKTCRTLPEKQERTHRRRSPMDPFTWTCNVGRTERTYLQQLCTDTGCHLEDLPGAMDDRGEKRERERGRERESGKSVLAVRHDDDMYIILRTSRM